MPTSSDRSTAPFVHDVVIIGGGPAGASCARLLAAWGHSVLILTRAIDRQRALAESLPPSTRKLLQTIGVLDRIERHGFIPNRGNVVRWGNDAHADTFDGNEGAGFQVFRPDLDALLLDAAREAGVEVHAGAIVRAVDGADPVSVRYEVEGAIRTVAGRMVLDCSGRSGVIARRGYRRYEPGHRMQALIGIWEGEAGADDDDRTLVETYDDGWAWAMALDSTRRQVAVMVDGATTGTRRGPTIADTYAHELRKTTELRARLRRSRLERVWACDASLYTAEAFADRGMLLVGDAASTIDPLSSYGVKKALASAWLAAVAVHTSLIDATRAGLAFDFYGARERQVYVADLSRTRDFARRAYARHAHPFWAGRMGDGEKAVEASDDEQILGSASVRATFDALRQRQSLDVRWSALMQPVRHPRVRNREIVLDEALYVAGDARRFVAGIDLLLLARLAPEFQQVGDLYETYKATRGDTALPHFLAALSLLIAEGLLEFTVHATVQSSC